MKKGKYAGEKNKPTQGAKTEEDKPTTMLLDLGRPEHLATKNTKQTTENYAGEPKKLTKKTKLDENKQKSVFVCPRNQYQFNQATKTIKKK